MTQASAVPPQLVGINIGFQFGHSEDEQHFVVTWALSEYTVFLAFYASCIIIKRQLRQKTLFIVSVVNNNDIFSSHACFSELITAQSKLM